MEFKYVLKSCDHQYFRSKCHVWCMLDFNAVWFAGWISLTLGDRQISHPFPIDHTFLFGSIKHSVFICAEHWTINVVNWIESGLEKGDETIRTMPWHRRVRALEKNWNARKNWLRRLQNFARRDMMCSCARRVAWFHQVTNKRNQTCFACIEELQEGEHSGKKSLIRWSIEKICSVQSSQLLLEVLAIGFTLKWTAKLW